MPEDVGGTPPYDGPDPDDSHDHGGADEEFATVVFDEDFVRSAAVHEPSAVERLLAAAEARAQASEAEGHLFGRPGPGEDFGPHHEGADGEFGYHSDLDEFYDGEPDEDYGHGYARWHRPVAWMLALVMGVGMVALAFTAVTRGASSPSRQEPGRPTTSSEVDKGMPAAPGAGIGRPEAQLSGVPGRP
ncbi:hypothetical protein HUT18_08515 [Streptomyces sp. NA04227]|uniref:SCO2584 family spore wall biosynthesis protein n=1 Tax=Streptomyces sp. NA04227 TaxID=2742136 RepID=UPI0015914D12|nr:hypothetical protein [Streptomyces sp. NA04227]QKW06439.1 hypothetical protein HUT18_08515 [Streptomyces sp. NA04227]